MQIAGGTFLVTGGGSGLGAATAQRLVNRGGNVVLLDVNAAAGERLSSELGDRARFIRADVTAEEDVNAAVSMALDVFGALHGVVNCAGVAIAERVLGKRGVHELASFVRVVHVNLIGTFNVVRLAAEAIARNEPGESGERGVIVNTASIAAFDGQIGQAAYAASKGGVAAMTLPLARDLASVGIRVMTIAPGVFATPMLAGLPEAAQASLAQQIPFPQRLGRPEEFAALVEHILENQMLNGEVIRLDGAIRMAPK
ncbi:MAG: 3-hydroxyacyl-CoA dehydrogenase [Caldilinea sp.]|nr:3-hydroxyacyl-CoA dehydrogenase [Caldilinea sp.]MDW8441466.1 3-hydroxyacyl-CoA dehydrogenase [Caldilineaceae bacterium]